MTVMTDALRVREVSKRFGRRTVLRDVELQVEAGRAVVLLGPNGAGKSTLLGCICGTVIPDAGRIEIAGHDLREHPLLARAALRYLAQEPMIPDALTGHELLRFHADVHRAVDDLPRVVAASGLHDALDRLATTYSVGMRRRLAFAATLLGQPRLLVLDEPFAGVDRDGRARMLEALQQALRAGAGIVLAAHDRDEAELQALQARAFELTSPAEATS